MSELENMKEVNFNAYCPTCKYEKTPEGDDPCHDCLNEPARKFSHKPMNWEKKKNV